MCAAYRDERYLSLETYRKNGGGVRTPVWFVTDGAVIHIRTFSDSGKAKRMALNQRVRIAPCTFSGSLKGDWVDGTARPATASESATANEMFGRRYGLQKRFTDLAARLRRRRYAAYVIVPGRAPETQRSNS